MRWNPEETCRRGAAEAEGVAHRLDELDVWKCMHAFKAARACIRGGGRDVERRDVERRVGRERAKGGGSEKEVDVMWRAADRTVDVHVELVAVLVEELDQVDDVAAALVKQLAQLGLHLRRQRRRWKAMQGVRRHEKAWKAAEAARPAAPLPCLAP